MFGEGLGERVEDVPAPVVARKGDLESPCECQLDDEKSTSRWSRAVEGRQPPLSCSSASQMEAASLCSVGPRSIEELTDCVPFPLGRTAAPLLPLLDAAALALLLLVLAALPNMPAPPPRSTGCALPPLLRELRAPSLVLVGGSGIMVGWYAVDMLCEARLEVTAYA